MENTTRERETLNALLELKFGVADTANPLGEVARIAGYKNEYDMGLSFLLGIGREKKPKERKAPKNTPLPGDEKVPDEEVLITLESAVEESEDGWVRGTDWFKLLQPSLDALGLTMSKTGFYARVKKLVEDGEVESRQVEVEKKLYGRDVTMNVTLYRAKEVAS